MFGLDTIKKYWAAKAVQDAAEKVDWSTFTGKGWKTYTGAALIAASVILDYVGCQGCAPLSEALLKVGEALGLVGMRHAIAKGGK